MSRSRCGNKDPPLSFSKNTVRSLGLKWSRSTLTWSLRNYSPRIGAAESQRIIQQAFDAWFQHIPLDVKQVCSTCPANIVIDFGYRDHGDGYHFDGPGGTLAHAYYPEDGRIHFDMDEPWTNSYDGYNINLYVVAVHEIGHALGVEHVFEKTSIMYPRYQLMKNTDILPQFDRIIIQQKYGSAFKTTKPTTTKKTTQLIHIVKNTQPTRITKTTTKMRATTRFTKTSSSINKLSCQQFIDAGFDFPNNTFHALDTGMLRRYLPDKKKWDTQVTPYERIYHRLPNRISGGAYDFATREVLIFTSTRVYRYKIQPRSYQVKYHRDDSLPDHLQSVIVGAIYYQDGIQVIKAKSLQSLNIEHLQRKPTERKLSQEFPGLSGSVRAAFTSGYMHYFFTSDRLVYVWDEQFNQWKTFAKPMSKTWFACMKEK